MTSETVWLNTAQAAERLGVDVRTMERYCRQGLVPAYKISGPWRIDKAELERFIRTRRNTPQETTDAGAVK